MYASTRNNEKQYSTFEVITGIMPNDGGNIVPSSIRSVSKDELTELENCDFTEITAFTLKKFFPDLTSKECLSLAEKAAKSALVFSILAHRFTYVHSCHVLSP